MRHRTLLGTALAGLLAFSAAAQERVAPTLPRVLLIGDSISLGYTRPVQQRLARVAEVRRVKGNAGDTGRGLQRIEQWLAVEPGAWDVIHFNWGLWDLCYRNPESKTQGRRDKVNGSVTFSVRDYAANLDKLVARLQRTGAHLVFATTTPVPPGEAGRKAGDDLRYNAAAVEIMHRRGVAIDDLHGAVRGRMAELQKRPGDVHFTDAGNAVLAAQVARSIERVLQQRFAGKRPRGAPRLSWRPARKEVYRRTEQAALALHVFEPDHHDPKQDRRPAIVLFFGGGWVGGSPNQFYPHCDYLAGRGMVAIAAEYRVGKKHQTTPFECVADGRAAIRWVRANAARLGIDPARIAAGGGSAGGHVAAATATLTAFGDDDAEVDDRPGALVLFNPVYDNGPDGYGHRRVEARWREISPAHNIRAGMPPAIVFLGTKDRLIPVATGERFQAKMRAVGSRSELRLYDGRAHGFFNHGRGDGGDYQDTVFEMDAFLASLGYLTGVPTIRPAVGQK